MYSFLGVCEISVHFSEFRPSVKSKCCYSFQESISFTTLPLSHFLLSVFSLYPCFASKCKYHISSLVLRPTGAKLRKFKGFFKVTSPRSCPRPPFVHSSNEGWGWVNDKDALEGEPCINSCQTHAKMLPFVVP